MAARAHADEPPPRSNGSWRNQIGGSSCCMPAVPKACSLPARGWRCAMDGRVRSRSSVSWAAGWAAATAASCRCVEKTAASIMCAPASRARCWRPTRSCGSSTTTMDLSVRIGALELKNPLIAASGCFGYGVEYADFVDLSSLGGVAVKGLFLSEREGHPPPRIVETPAGMLNAIGLQGIGVRRFVDEKLPELRARKA